MGRKGNSGYTNPDVRSGTNEIYSGSLGPTQHYLERLEGRLGGELSPPDPTVWYDAADVALRSGTSNILTWFDQSGNGITASGNGSLNTPLYNATDATFGGYPSLQFDNT